MRLVVLTSTLLIVTLCVAECPSAATLVIPTAVGEVRLHFDPLEISEERLRELTVLGPYQPWPFLPPALNQCISTDPEYRECGSREIDAPNFLYDAEVNLRRGRQTLADIARLEPPSELAPVLAYFQHVIAVFICLHEAELAYYRGDDHALEVACDEIDATAVCSDLLLEAPLTGMLEARRRLAGFTTWITCMAPELVRQLGVYPLEAWRDFLRAAGIVEEVVELPVGD